MSGNADLILAGVSGGGTGNALCYIGRTDAAAPTDATSPLAASADEQQTVTISGTPTGGTFTLTFAGSTTAGIAYNAAASAVKSALEALASVGSGNVNVSGSAGGPYTVTFVGDLAAQNVASMTASAASLTGGSSPSVAIATLTPGASGWVDAGWCDESGLAEKIAKELKDIKAFGASSPVRRLKNSQTETFDITYLEHNATTLEVYYELEPGSLVVDTDGSCDIETGTPRTSRFSVVFETVDGDNLRRVYIPLAEAERSDTAVTGGDVIKLPVTITAYVDDSGVAVHRFFVLDALAA